MWIRDPQPHARTRHRDRASLGQRDVEREHVERDREVGRAHERLGRADMDLVMATRGPRHDRGRELRAQRGPRRARRGVGVKFDHQCLRGSELGDRRRGGRRLHDVRGVVELEQRREPAPHRGQHLRGQLLLGVIDRGQRGGGDDERVVDRAVTRVPDPSRQGDGVAFAHRDRAIDDEPGALGHRHLGADHDDVEPALGERAGELARDGLTVELELGVGVEREQRDAMRGLGLGVPSARDERDRRDGRDGQEHDQLRSSRLHDHELTGPGPEPRCGSGP